MTDEQAQFELTENILDYSAPAPKETTMTPVRIVDDDDITGAEAWSIFTTLLNADELLDEIALAARVSSHGRAAYEILREASGDTIPTLAARLFTIDARNSRA